MLACQGALLGWGARAARKDYLGSTLTYMPSQFCSQRSGPSTLAPTETLHKSDIKGDKAVAFRRAPQQLMLVSAEANNVAGEIDSVHGAEVGLNFTFALKGRTT